MINFALERFGVPSSNGVVVCSVGAALDFVSKAEITRLLLLLLLQVWQFKTKQKKTKNNLCSFYTFNSIYLINLTLSLLFIIFLYYYLRLFIVYFLVLILAFPSCLKTGSCCCPWKIFLFRDRCISIYSLWVAPTPAVSSCKHGYIKYLRVLISIYDSNYFYINNNIIILIIFSLFFFFSQKLTCQSGDTAGAELLQGDLWTYLSPLQNDILHLIVAELGKGFLTKSWFCLFSLFLYIYSK